MNKKEITLPSGKKAEIVEYVEAGVIIDLEKAPNPTEYILRNLVISIDGNSDKVYENIRKLKIADYRALDKELVSLIKAEEEIPKVS